MTRPTPYPVAGETAPYVVLPCGMSAPEIRLNIRLPAQLRDAAIAATDARGMTISEYVRSALEDLVAQDAGDVGAPAVRLTDQERARVADEVAARVLEQTTRRR